MYNPVDDILSVRALFILNCSPIYLDSIKIYLEINDAVVNVFRDLHRFVVCP